MIRQKMFQIEPTIENAELLAFVTVVDAGSLTRAAAQLRLPRATVGRRLTRLEERLEARLLLRTTRTQSLTDAGAAFYRQARLALEAVARAEASVREEVEGLSGSLRVSAPGGQVVRALVLEFALAHPHVQMQAHFGTQHIDLCRDGYDVAIRAGMVADQGLIARPLMRTTLIAIASPTYLEQQGTPRHLRDLQRHRA